MAVNTSVVVQFTSTNGGSSLTAEIDGREDGLNGGATSFRPGDSAYFLVFGTEGVVIDSVSSSAGSVHPVGSGLFEVEEWLTFTDSKEASLSKPAYTPVTYEWYGNNLGAITAVGTSAGCASKGLGCAKVKYSALYSAYRLDAPAQLNGKADFQISVLVKGHD